MACCLTWPIRLELSQRCHVTARAGRRLFRLCRLRTDEERPKLERKSTSFWGLLPARSTILVASEDGTFETKRKRKAGSASSLGYSGYGSKAWYSGAQSSWNFWMFIPPTMV